MLTKLIISTDIIADKEKTHLVHKQSCKQEYGWLILINAATRSWIDSSKRTARLILDERLSIV